MLDNGVGLKKEFFIVFATLLSTFIILTPVLADVSFNELNSSTIVRYDSRILDLLKNQTEVRVMVSLKDNSGVVVSGTTEERRNISKQKDEWFYKTSDEVLSTLSGEEFSIIGKLSSGFGGYITKKGFDKLINDPRIEMISLDIMVHAQSNNTLPEIKNENIGIFESFRLIMLNIVNYLKSFLVKSVEKYVLSLGENNTPVSNKSPQNQITNNQVNETTLSQNLTGYINKTQPGVSSGQHQVNEYGISYDSEILENLNNSYWFPVVVFVKDSSKTNLILSSLSPEDFQLVRNDGEGFSGKISKQGYNKLINNSYYIAAIYWDRPLHLSLN